MSKFNTLTLDDAIRLVSTFRNGNLKDTLKKLESGKEQKSDAHFEAIFSAAKLIKSASAQIDEIVHAAGIMIAKEIWLRKDEQVLYLSLGAGSHKGSFDLETKHRIAEFKFGKWNEDSANGTRRRGYFSNYVGLLTSNDEREKYFVMEDKNALLKFLKGKSAWKNVLSKNPTAYNQLEGFLKKNKMSQLETVGQIFDKYKDEVTIVDFSEIIKTETDVKL